MIVCVFKPDSSVIVIVSARLNCIEATDTSYSTLLLGNEEPLAGSETLDDITALEYQPLNNLLRNR